MRLDSWISEPDLVGRLALRARVTVGGVGLTWSLSGVDLGDADTRRCGRHEANGQLDRA